MAKLNTDNPELAKQLWEGLDPETAEKFGFVMRYNLGSS
jgi:hypothetical protein